MCELQAIFDELKQAKQRERFTFTAQTVLRTVLDASAHLSASAHPLGFTCVYLSDAVTLDRSTEDLRLHLWSASGAADDFGSVHDHMWHLKSAVLLGALENCVYTFRSQSAGAYRGFRVGYGASTTFTDVGGFDLTDKRSVEIAAPAVYEIAERIPHSSVVRQSPAVTLVYTRQSSPDVAGPLIFTENSAARGTSRRRGLSPGALRGVLHDYLDAAVSVDVAE